MQHERTIVTRNKHLSPKSLAPGAITLTQSPAYRGKNAKPSLGRFFGTNIEDLKSTRVEDKRKCSWSGSVGNWLFFARNLLTQFYADLRHNALHGLSIVLLDSICEPFALFTRKLRHNHFQHLRSQFCRLRSSF